jgi:hypothetical protein
VARGTIPPAWDGLREQSIHTGPSWSSTLCHDPGGVRSLPRDRGTRRLALEGGMVTLRRSGLEEVKAGVATIEEIPRVTEG